MPDGTFWFTEENVDQVGVIDQSGNVIEYPTGKGQFPTNITAGPDGNVWFTEEIANNIVRLDPQDPFGQTEFPIARFTTSSVSGRAVLRSIPRTAPVSVAGITKTWSMGGLT